MATLIVLNPAARNAKEVLVDDLAALAGEDTSVVKPRSASSFRAEVTAAARGAERIVVLGGDGTFNAAVNAFDHRYGSICWGLVPAGTGNDLARTLGLPEEPLEAMEVALGDATTEIDVVCARADGSERLFVNASMGGFPTDVDRETSEELKERFGPFAFWVAGAKASSRLDRTRVTVNGQRLDDCVAVGVGNGRTCGGGIEVWPEADPSDGRLEACALAIPGPAAAARLIPRLLRGTHEGIDEVMVTNGARIVVDSDPPIELNADGELVGLKTPVTYEVAGKLQIASPA